MRILYHCPATFIGGAERQLEYLIKHLRRLAPSPADFDPLITYESPKIGPFLEGFGVPCVLAPDRKSLAAAIDGFAPDVLQFYTSPRLARTLGLLRKKPRVIEVIHNKNQFPGDTTSYTKERVAQAICVSPDAEAFINRHFPLLPACVIPNGVDEDLFYPDCTGRAPVPVVGFAGRLCPDKGIDTLFAIAEQLPCRLELVGQDFGRYVERKPENVDLFGHVDDMAPFYRRWWAFVSASPHESFGMAIAEAMACGCPPVMLDCGGITAYLESGRHGFIAHDALGLVSGVRLALDMARETLCPLEPDFSAERMAETYLEVYRAAAPAATEPIRHSAGQTAATTASGAPAVRETARLFRPVPGRPLVPGGALGVAPAAWYGVIRALAGVCDHYAEPAAAIKLIDEVQPRVVVLGCYQPEWARICKHAHRRGAKVVGTWHASYILNEFHDINRTWMAALLDAKKAGVVDYLATPHAGLAASWSHFGFETSYLPNVIDTDVPTVPKLDGVHIGILGSGQTWKNMECQIVAAAMCAADATIHVQEVANQEVIKRLGIKVTVHPKTLTDQQWYEVLGGMTVNMCVSLSEVYSYLTMESFLLGTPVLTGSITPVLWGGLAGKLELPSWCATAHFEDPAHMASMLESLVNRGRSWPELREHAKAVDAESRAVCAGVIRRWV